MNSYVNISQQDQNNFAKVIAKGNVYFIGIGGIGMSALAKYFLHLGCSVSGYDKTATALTMELSSLGASIHFEENENYLMANADVVIYTPAVPKTHIELVYYQSKGYTVLKRSQVLGLLTMHSKNICVAGTHGKTTVSTIVSHLLQHSGYGCNAFLGGISTNYNTNFLSSTNNVCVIEADEYDRSFLQLSPTMAVVTSMDADHLDIYGTAESVEEAFVQFSKQIQDGGFLIAKYGLPKFDALQANTKYSYHLTNTNATVYATNIIANNGAYTFNVMLNGVLIENVLLKVGGLHNIENTLAAITIANQCGINMQKIKEAVATYKGVKRRFEYIIAPSVSSNIVMIDDYAHHPTELQALISGVQSLFPNHKKIIVFQPHLYSRTRDFAANFANSLSAIDNVMLLPIYPARELPIEGVTSNMLLHNITASQKIVIEKNELVETIKKQITNQPTVVIMAGAGDIDLLLEPVKNMLLNL